MLLLLEAQMFEPYMKLWVTRKYANVFLQMCFAQIYCILIIAQDQILTGNIGLFQTTSTAARSYPGFPDENYPFRILHWIHSQRNNCCISF